MQSNDRSVGVSLLLESLRSGTAQLHIALEKRLPFFSLSLNHARYQRLIQAYYGFYSPLERCLKESGELPIDIDFSERFKTSILRSDLLALGLRDELIASLPQCDSLPPMDSAEACLGVLYVVEGATLGGQILRREISARLNLSADSGAAFLDVYGINTGRRWREFTDYLASSTFDAHARQIVVSAAQDTFACFERWLDSNKVLL